MMSEVLKSVLMFESDDIISPPLNSGNSGKCLRVLTNFCKSYQMKYALSLLFMDGNFLKIHK